ncbi:Ovarian tumor [Macleaya cordata]|uniref:Ubiquitin thioesterase OTU n=1 Tax=Macleaya cordata TaxID=56857 RepID=A0A200R584_MACCD|nr:Ovarian tumor [Macleaya cordata]
MILPTREDCNNLKSAFDYHEHKGEGSWNVAWDVRPARWLRRSNSEWLLFGVCTCLAPLDCCGENLDATVAVIEGFISGFEEEIRSERNYRVTGVPADGRCLFRAVSYGVCLRSGEESPDGNRQRELANDLRARVADELLKRREETEWFIEGDFDAYVKNIQQTNTWGGEPELLMAAHVLKTPISVFTMATSSGDLIKVLWPGV